MIPDFDLHGLIPPIRPGQAGHSPDRAPYTTDLLTFCQRFGTSAERRAILRGLIDLRAALRGAGVARGFQWLDGSFAEDVERLRGRPPADIDVVTFCAFGSVEQQREMMAAAPELFDPLAAKARYAVDHYLVQTDEPRDVTREGLVALATYWYSMWAHQRGTERWKGFVAVSLSSTDHEAKAWLDHQATRDGGGAP